MVNALIALWYGLTLFTLIALVWSVHAHNVKTQAMLSFMAKILRELRDKH